MKEKIEIIRNMGFNWALFRTNYEIKKKMGLLRKQFPSFVYEEIQLNKYLREKKKIKDLLNQSRHRYFFSEIPEELNKFNEFNLEKAITEADSICSQKFKYFSYHSIQFNEIDWHLNPNNKKVAPSNKHWTEIPDLGSEFGDIKWVWELSRFTFVFPLVRAYAVSKNDRYVEVFWTFFEDFIKKNPPEMGPNYKCGQEMSFRIMAWTFGLFAFLDHPFSTEKRLELMLKAIYHHADHIERHFDFALKSVRNNHSISEAVGMYTVGILFPFLLKSEKWRKKGKKYIHSEAMWQIYDDGSYIQHSMNYQRLVIQDLTWAIRLGEINNDLFEQKLIERVEKAILFMFHNQELETGKVPNYGMNDGAYILPLTSCDYLDYRPSLQAAWHVIKKELLYSETAVNEMIFWISGSTSLQSNISKINQQTIAFRNGGYYTMRDRDTFGMVRCTTYKHRPAQADMLHFDLWYKDKNVFADAGTFSYNTDVNKMIYFNGTASHNTVMIDEQDQMKKALRFMWLNWTKSSTIDFVQKKGYQLFIGEHYGYDNITHRRAVLHSKNHWVIVDDIFGKVQTEKFFSLHWLFGIQDITQTKQFEWLATLSEQERLKVSIYSTSDYMSSLYKGSIEPLRGWRSLYYGHKEPYPQLVIKCKSSIPLRFVTVIDINEGQHKMNIDNGRLLLDKTEYRLTKIGNQKVFNF